MFEIGFHRLIMLLERLREMVTAGSRGDEIQLAVIQRVHGGENRVPARQCYRRGRQPGTRVRVIGRVGGEVAGVDVAVVTVYLVSHLGKDLGVTENTCHTAHPYR